MVRTGSVGYPVPRLPHTPLFGWRATLCCLYTRRYHTLPRLPLDCGLPPHRQHMTRSGCPIWIPTRSRAPATRDIAHLANSDCHGYPIYCDCGPHCWTRLRLTYIPPLCWFPIWLCPFTVGVCLLCCCIRRRVPHNFPGGPRGFPAATGDYRSYPILRLRL